MAARGSGVHGSVLFSNASPKVNRPPLDRGVSDPWSERCANLVGFVSVALRGLVCRKAPVLSGPWDKDGVQEGMLFVTRLLCF